VVSTPLKNISQLGFIIPNIRKKIHVPNHQPDTGFPEIGDTPSYGWFTVYWFLTDKSYWHGSYIINDFPLRKHFVAESRRLHPLALQPPGSGHPRRSARPVET
jgi:hypothetical protein